MTAYPITVPLHVAAALRPGETAECDLDTGTWHAVAGHGRRELRRPLNSLEALVHRLRPFIVHALPTDIGEVLDRLDIDARVPVCSTSVPQAEAEVIDGMRRFYEHGGAAC